MNAIRLHEMAQQRVLIVDGGNYCSTLDKVEQSLKHGEIVSHIKVAAEIERIFDLKFSTKFFFQGTQSTKPNDFHKDLGKPPPHGPHYNLEIFGKKKQSGQNVFANRKEIVSILVEEGVDVAVGTKIIECAYGIGKEQECDKIVVITGDGDLLRAIECADGKKRNTIHVIAARESLSNSLNRFVHVDRDTGCAVYLDEIMRRCVVDTRNQRSSNIVSTSHIIPNHIDNNSYSHAHQYQHQQQQQQQMQLGYAVSAHGVRQPYDANNRLIGGHSNNNASGHTSRLSATTISSSIANSTDSGLHIAPCLSSPAVPAALDVAAHQQTQLKGGEFFWGGGRKKQKYIDTTSDKSNSSNSKRVKLNSVSSPSSNSSNGNNIINLLQQDEDNASTTVNHATKHNTPNNANNSTSQLGHNLSRLYSSISDTSSSSAATVTTPSAIHSTVHSTTKPTETTNTSTSTSSSGTGNADSVDYEAYCRLLYSKAIPFTEDLRNDRNRDNGEDATSGTEGVCNNNRISSSSGGSGSSINSCSNSSGNNNSVSVDDSAGAMNARLKAIVDFLPSKSNVHNGQQNSNGTGGSRVNKVSLTIAEKHRIAQQQQQEQTQTQQRQLSNQQLGSFSGTFSSSFGIIAPPGDYRSVDSASSSDGESSGGNRYSYHGRSSSSVNNNARSGGTGGRSGKTTDVVIDLMDD